VNNKTDFGFVNWIYRTIIQLVTTVHQLLTQSSSSSGPSWLLTTFHYSTTPLYSLNSDLPVCLLLRPMVSRPVCLGIKHPSDSYYCQTVASLLMWGALSDWRTSRSFTITAGPRQRSHSRVRVLWNLRPYYTVSDSRLPFRRLLRLTGLRWRYSTLSSHRIFSSPDLPLCSALLT
jgi:hypothetical protein